MKKFDFEISTYLYVLRSPEFIYAIFRMFYPCICVVCMCFCVCIWVNAIASKWCIRLSLDLVCILLIIVGKKPMYFNKCMMCIFFFYWRTKNISYALRSMMSNYYKSAITEAVDSIQFKFNKYIIGHRLAYFIDFCNFRINNFL